MQAQAVIDRVRQLLNSDDETRWSNEELVGWLNDAQTAIAEARPEACVKTATLTLGRGTRQTLPDEALGLVDVTRNMRVKVTV
jgi:hypothetical protein